MKNIAPECPCSSRPARTMSTSRDRAFTFRLPHKALWIALGAFVAGATLFALPLIRTSTLSLVDGQVFLRRSRAFLWVLFGLVAVRLLLRQEISHYISPLQTGSLFFVLAFGMIVHWRLDMLAKFKRLAPPPA